MADSSREIVPVNGAQRDAWEAGRVPEVESLGDGVWSIPLAIPAGTLPATLAYALVGDDGVHLIDPGWDSTENLALLEQALARTGRTLNEVATVIVTHHHPDHLGLAARLRTLAGARIVMSSTERRVLAEVVSDAARDPECYRRTLRAWGVPEGRHGELIASFSRPSLTGDVQPDREVSDGDVIDVAGRRLEVLATPGHTGGHICLVDREARMLFTGDHVLPRIYSGVGIGSLAGDDPLGDLLASLDRLAEFDDFDVLPGHEFRFTGLGPRRARIAAHHLRRTGEVAALAAELGDRTVWDYASRLTWTSGWDGLESFWLHSALRQTEIHLSLVRSGEAEKRLSLG